MEPQKYLADEAQAAEIYAAIVALRTVEEFSLAAGIKLLVLKVSSNYLPQHM
jgi:hypothetical protein